MAEAINRSRLKLDRHPLKPLNEAKNEALRGFHDGFALSLSLSLGTNSQQTKIILSLSRFPKPPFVHTFMA